MHIKQIDEAVIKGINEGCEKSFSMLYGAYYVYLNTVCFYWLNDEGASREVVNDVFMHVWNRRESITFPVHSYLVKAAQNGSIDYLRTRQSRLRMLNSHKEQFTRFYQESYIRATPEPLQYVELHAVEEEIQKALEGLPPRCREIFEAWLNTDKSADEIARSMDIKVSTVRVQLKNAFDRLRAKLGHLLLPLLFFIA